MQLITVNDAAPEHADLLRRTRYTFVMRLKYGGVLVQPFEVHHESRTVRQRKWRIISSWIASKHDPQPMPAIPNHVIESALQYARSKVNYDARSRWFD